jgi:hypothetical protein
MVTRNPRKLGPSEGLGRCTLEPKVEPADPGVPERDVREDPPMGAARAGDVGVAPLQPASFDRLTSAHRSCTVTVVAAG